MSVEPDSDCFRAERAATAAGCRAEVDLPGGVHLLIRPVRPDDRSRITEALDRMSARSRYLRFFAPVQELTDSMLTALTEADHGRRFAWVALACEGDHEALVGVARYVRQADPRTAEVALTVIDPYQGRGIGHLLLDALVLAALQAGVTRFEGEALVENTAIRAVLAAAGARFHRRDGGTLHFAFDLGPHAAALRTHPQFEQLRGLTGVSDGSAG